MDYHIVYPFIQLSKAKTVQVIKLLSNPAMDPEYKIPSTEEIPFESPWATVLDALCQQLEPD